VLLESVLIRRRKARGRPLDAATSPLSDGSDYSEYPTQADKGQLGKLGRGLTDTDTQEVDPVLSTLTNREPEQNLQHATCYVNEFGNFIELTTAIIRE